jgi:hypothetical protein
MGLNLLQYNVEIAGLGILTVLVINAEFHSTGKKRSALGPCYERPSFIISSLR